MIKHQTKALIVLRNCQKNYAKNNAPEENYRLPNGNFYIKSEFDTRYLQIFVVSDSEFSHAHNTLTMRTSITYNP